MQRLECLRAIYGRLEDCLVVTIMGAVATELHSLGHRSNFFYLQHAMGLASSTGLGLAMCLPHQKVVIFDNESLLSVGGFPTATSTGSDLEALARAAGIARTSTVHAIDEFTQTFD